jgi:hypothetical protein
MIDLIVGIVTVMAVGSLVLWIGLPRLRTWIEQPKYRILQNDQRQKETK